MGFKIVLTRNTRMGFKYGMTRTYFMGFNMWLANYFASIAANNSFVFNTNF